MLAVDCHTHIFTPERFPYQKGTPYEPPAHETSSAEYCLAVLDAHRISHCVLVNPMSGYSFDNDCTLDAIKQSKGRFKGISLVPFDISEKEMVRLSDVGIVGHRFNLIDRPELLNDPALPKFLSKLKEANWILQVQCENNQMLVAAPFIEKSGLRVVIDHCGRPDPLLGLNQPGFKKLIELSQLENVHIKISGPFRFSQQPYPYSDADPYIEALIKSFTLDRCIWGSDWPFIRLSTRIDYGPTMAWLRSWLPDPKDQHKILWETPARLFGFS